MPKRAARKDANQNDIANALESVGCTVFDTSRLGLGFPDTVIVLPSGKLWMVEVKQEQGKFTKSEVSFLVWLVNDNYRVFTTAEQAVKAVMEDER